MPAQSYKFVMVVWGEQYTKSFLEITLPSQLWPGGIDAFADRDTSYVIYTGAKERPAIESSPSFQALGALARTKILLIEECISATWRDEDKYTVMNNCHIHAIKTSAEQDTAFMILYPDAIFSSGAFRRLRELHDSGKRMVLTVGNKAIAETFLPQFKDKYLTLEGLRPVGSRELAGFALQQMHSDFGSLVWGSRYSPNWLSVLFFRAPGGLIARSFHPTPIFIHPVDSSIVPKLTVDADYSLTAVPDYSDVHLVTDSDEICELEFVAKGQPRPEPPPNPITIGRICAWYRHGANSRHRQFVQHSIHYHDSDLTSEWAPARALSDSIVNEVLALTEAPPAKVTALLFLDDGALYTRELIEGLLRQSAQTEILALDKGANDGSVEIVQALMAKNPSIRLLHSDGNEGTLLARGLAEATGEYIYFATPGVVLREYAFDVMSATLRRFPTAALAFSPVESGSKATAARVLLPEDFYNVLSKENTPWGRSLFRRSRLHEACAKRPELHRCAEIYALIALGSSSSVCCMNEEFTSASSIGVFFYVQNVLSSELKQIVEFLLAAPSRDPGTMVLGQPRSREALEALLFHALVNKPGHEDASDSAGEQFPEVSAVVSEARKALASGNIEEAFARLVQGVLIPKTAEIAQLLAQVLRDHGGMQESLSILQYLVKSFGPNYSWLRQLAEVSFGTGNNEAAKNWYLRLLEIAPDDVGAHLGLVKVFVGLSKFPEVKKHFLEVVRLTPHEPHLWIDYARFIHSCGDVSGALEALHRASQFESERAEATALLAEIQGDARYKG